MKNLTRKKITATENDPFGCPVATPLCRRSVTENGFSNPFRTDRNVRSPLFSILAAAALVAGSLTSVNAADGVKDANATALNAASSWVGGNMPDLSGIATFDVTRNGKAASVPLGGSLSWQGMVATPDYSLTISNTAGAALTLGSNGLVTSGTSTAATNVTFSNALILGASQTWQNRVTGNYIRSIAVGNTIDFAGNTLTYNGTYGVSGSPQGTLTFSANSIISDSSAGKTAALRIESGGVTLSNTAVGGGFGGVKIIMAGGGTDATNNHARLTLGPTSYDLTSNIELAAHYRNNMILDSANNSTVSGVISDMIVNEVTTVGGVAFHGMGNGHIFWATHLSRCQTLLP